MIDGWLSDDTVNDPAATIPDLEYTDEGVKLVLQELEVILVDGKPRRRYVILTLEDLNDMIHGLESMELGED
jgi:hypothetical protein